jgi:hypothetical protein
LRLAALAVRSPSRKVQGELAVAIYAKAAEIRARRVQHGNIVGGNDCLPPEVYRAMARLVAKGWTERRIAAQLGVGRRAVAKFKLRGQPTSRYSRCPGCGHLVVRPCRICATRKRER